MIVVRHTQNGSYRFVELDATISNLRFAASRLVPYNVCSCTSIPVTRLVDQSDLARIFADEDVEGVVEDPLIKDEQILDPPAGVRSTLTLRTQHSQTVTVTARHFHSAISATIPGPRCAALYPDCVCSILFLLVLSDCVLWPLPSCQCILRLYPLCFECNSLSPAALETARLILTPFSSLSTFS
jgi:hypothetical protein